MNKENSNQVKWLRRMISHNIRMPMAIISGYAELLQNGEIETETEKQECLEKINQNIRYLSHMVSLILDDTIQREIPYLMQSIDIKKCVTDVVGYVGYEISKRNILIETDITEESIRISGDAIHLIGMIFQLMENALKYLAENQMICLELSCTGDGVRFSYKDNGPGMDREEVPHIFEPGFRGSNSGSVIGTGMGMPYVKEVIEKHGGTITINSEPGKGMSIDMYFPLPETSNL